MKIKCEWIARGCLTIETFVIFLFVFGRFYKNIVDHVFKVAHIDITFFTPRTGYDKFQFGALFPVAFFILKIID